MPSFFLTNSVSAISAYFLLCSLLSFQFLSKSIEFRPIIAIVFPEFLVLFGWSVQKLSHNRKIFTDKCCWILHSFLTQLHRTWVFPDSPFWAWVEAKNSTFVQDVWTFNGPCGNSRCIHWAVQICSTALEKGLICVWNMLDVLCVD